MGLLPVAFDLYRFDWKMGESIGVDWSHLDRLYLDIVKIKLSHI